MLFHGGVPKERAMKIDVSKFQVPEGEAVHLHKWPTLVKPVYHSKKDYQALLADHAARLCEQQKLLYACNSDALLVIFQAMDAAGKDGAIAHVMSGVNPQGCRVYSYKHPSTEELAHDFLWRTTRDMPERGQIGIFNRSYYEEVLIVRVHPELLKAQKLPAAETGKNVWKRRFKDIRAFEHHLARDGTLILKFHLRISKEEQRKRFLAPRRTVQALEVLHERRCRAPALGRVHGRLRGSDP
jgi:PPK2 family polyphosphate:nucleotide phosphotransferase